MPREREKTYSRVQDSSGQVFAFHTPVTRAVAVRRIRTWKRSAARYREFNREDPRRMVVRRLPADVPYIRIGKVPVITYQSRKEGRLENYQHKTRSMPTLFMHPTLPIGILWGAAIRVRDSLYCYH